MLQNLKECTFYQLNVKITKLFKMSHFIHIIIEFFLQTYYRLFEGFYEIIQMEYDKLLTQEEHLNDQKCRLIMVPNPPDTPRYTNNALYAVPTRHAAPDTSENYDSDVSQKGLRNILAQFRTASDDDDSDASPKYSPTGQCDSSNDESDSESDSESHQDDENASDSDVEIIS